MFYPDYSKSFSELIESLPAKTVVLGHARPDGDCLGSQIALCRILNALGKDAVAVNQDRAPHFLDSFIQDTPFQTVDNYTGKEEACVVCDSADWNRVGEKVKARFTSPIACIDHHISNKGYAEQNFIDADSAATCEMLAGFILDNGMPLDKTTAEALYAGIVTDTGMFRFPSTTRRVFEIAAQLLDAGVNPGEVTSRIYENESPAKFKLLQHFLESLRMELGGTVCIGTLPNGIYEKCGAAYEDSEGLVDYARSLHGVEVGILLEERGDSMKGSLRASRPEFRVDQLAGSFGGGGHACAAGFSADSSIEKFYPELLQAVTEHLKNTFSAS